MSLPGVYSDRQRGGGRGSNDKSGGRLFVRKDSVKTSVAVRRAVVSPTVPVPVNTPSFRSQASVQGGEVQCSVDLIGPARNRLPAGWSATDTSNLAPARGDARFTKHFPDLGEVELQKQKDEEEEALARANAVKISRPSSISQPSIRVTSLRPQSQSGGGHASAPLRPGGRVSCIKMKGKDGSGGIGPSSASDGALGDVGSKDPRRRRRGTGLLSGLDGGPSVGNTWRGMVDPGRKGKVGNDDAKNNGEEEWMQMEPIPGPEIKGEDGKGSTRNNSQMSPLVGVPSRFESKPGKQGESSQSSHGLAAQASSQADLPSVPVRSTRDPYYPGKSWVGRKEEERDIQAVQQQDQFETEAAIQAEAEIVVEFEKGGCLESVEPVTTVDVDSGSTAAEGTPQQPQMVEEEKELQIFREDEEAAAATASGEDRYHEKVDGSFGNEAAIPPPMGIAKTPEPEPAWGSSLSSLNYIQKGNESCAGATGPYIQNGSSSYSVGADPVIVGSRKVDWGGGATSQLLQNPVDGGTIHHHTLGSPLKTFDRAVVPPHSSSASPAILKQVKSENSWMNLEGGSQLPTATPTTIAPTPTTHGVANGSHRVFSSLDLPISSHPWAAPNSHPISKGVGGHLPHFHHSASEHNLVQIFSQLGSGGGSGEPQTGSGGNGGKAPGSSSSGVFREGGGVNLLAGSGDIMHGSAATHGHEFYSLSRPTPSPPPVGHFANALPISSTTASMSTKNNEGRGYSNLQARPPKYLNRNLKHQM